MMKKLLVILMAVFCLMSCSKDGAVKNLYHNSASIDGVAYELNIVNQGEDYSWTVLNKTDEVSLRYTYNYERKSDLQKDFGELAEGVKAFDENLLPAFEEVFRFLNDEDHQGFIYREVSGGNVFVRFVIGEKAFKLPYAFVIGADEALNPKQ